MFDTLKEEQANFYAATDQPEKAKLLAEYCNSLQNHLMKENQDLVWRSNTFSTSNLISTISCASPLIA
jgi:hemerythrin-like domain-containing protein